MTAAEATASQYDDFAWFYNRYWGPITCNPPFFTVIERLLLSRLPAGARVLDVCCGTGQMARKLTAMGFKVTGIDASLAQLEYARVSAPEADFIHADVRSFRLEPVYDAALSVFDSLNHVMTMDELGSAFAGICGALMPAGSFLFDLNTEEGLRGRWKGFNAQVEEDNAFIMRLSYAPEEKVARADTTMFRREAEAWLRSDTSFTQAAYAEEDVAASLAANGFAEISTNVGIAELDPPMGEGRTFFLARKHA